MDVLTKKNDVTCKEIMTKNVIFIETNRTIGYACKIMERHGISQLPVLKKGKVIGVVTESAIIRHIRCGIEREKISRVMEPPLPIVHEKTKTDSIRPLLENYNAVLVSNGEKITGIITKSDFFKLLKT
jgi:predicted transcriptional regulator